MNGTFEDKLLGELKQVVADRTAGMAPVRARWRPRLVVTASVAAALGLIAAVGIPVLTADQGSPAWAVTLTGDRVHVTINDYRDASGLERKLRELGVNAKVDHPPAGKTCGRRGWLMEHSAGDSTIWFDGRADSLSFWFDRDVVGPGETLIIETRVFDVRLGNDVPEDEKGIRSVPSIHVVAATDVPPCDPVPDDRPAVVQIPR